MTKTYLDIKQELRKLRPTFIFYIIATIIISILYKLFPNGPCVPGFGLLAIVVLPIISAFLFLKNIMTAGKLNNSVTLVHLIAIIILVIIIFC